MATSLSEFKTDLRTSLRAWKVAPLLPAMSVVLVSFSFTPDRWWWVAFPGILFWVGWFGTERIWYLRIYRHNPISAGELWRLTWAFFWRFTRLGILSAITWSPVVIIGFQRSSDNPERVTEAFADTDLLILSAVLTLIVDFIL